MSKFEVEKDWITESGLRAVCLKLAYGNRWNHRCGYVGIPEDHPLHGVLYHEQSDCLTREMAQNSPVGNKSSILIFTAGVNSDGEGLVRRSPDCVFECHGGLTYSRGEKNYPVEHEGLWWFGFDCNHAWDAPIERDPNSISIGYDMEERSMEYVISECEKLAAQLAEIPKDHTL